MKLRTILTLVFFILPIFFATSIAADKQANEKIIPEVVGTGAISGTVYESNGVTPIGGVTLIVYNSSWGVVKYAYANEYGQYLASGLGAGSYYVHADGNYCYGGASYYGEYYNESSDKSGADLVTVTEPDTAININFTLNKKGSIGGRVTEIDGTTPIAHTMINVYNLSWESVSGAETNSNGYYTIYGLDTDYYYVEAMGYVTGQGEFYVQEYYNHSFTKGGATSVGVTAPNTTDGINFALTRGFHVYIDVIPDWGGYVNIAPEKLVYTPGDVVTLTAQVGEVYTDYQFDHWSGDASGTSATTTIVMNDDMYVNAHFVPISSTVYNLVINVNPEYSGYYIKEPNQIEYDSASVVQMTAYPNTDWAFSHWSGDHSGSDNPASITMNSNKIVTANFYRTAPRTFYLSVSADPYDAGEVIRDPDLGAYDSASVVQLLANPITGWVFKNWSIDHSGTDNPTNVAMNTDKYVAANFGHSLETIVSPEGIGSINRVPDKDIYGHGEPVQLTANPPDGYVFERWDGDIDGTQNPANITMNLNKTVYAVFAAEPVTHTLMLHVNPEGGGYTYPDPEYPHTCQPGEVVNVYGMAQDCYTFSHWTGDVADPESSSTTVTMNGDKNITANFVQETYDTLYIQINPENGGSTYPLPWQHHIYVTGSEVYVSAEAESGYSFSHWTGSVNNPESASTMVLLNESKTITANFIQGTSATLWIDAYPPDGGTTTPSPGEYSYDIGDVVTITAEPEAGYSFSYWSGAVANPQTPVTTVTMNESKSVMAHFQQSSAFLTIQICPTEGGWSSPEPGTHEYELGTIVEITAMPEGDMWEFVGWTGGVANPESLTTTVTMYYNQTVKANFEQKFTSLTMKVYPENGGWTDPEPGSYIYEKNDTVNISATPADGFRFVKWKCNVADPYNPNTVVYMTYNETVTAHFEPLTSKLTMQVYPQNGGWTNPDVGVHTYETGSVVTVTAESAEGYRFTHWSDNVSDPASQTTTILVNADKRVKAYFEPVQYILQISVNPEVGGRTEPGVGKYTYNAGETVEITAVPAEGYEFAGWSGPMIEDPDSATITVTMYQNKQIIANFRPAQYTLILSVYPDSGGRLEPEVGEHLYNAGEVVEVTAIPADGFKFAGWMGDVPDVVAEDTSRSTISIVMDKDKELSALFEPVYYLLSISAYPDSGGYTKPGPGEHYVRSGKVVEIVAIPERGFRFVGWRGDVPDIVTEEDSDSSIISIVMDQDKEIEAVFEQVQYVLKIAVEPDSGGTTKPEPGEHYYKSGEVVEIVAIPDRGFRFIGWRKDVPDVVTEENSDSSTISIVMDQDKVIEAIFEQIHYTLKVNAEPDSGGKIEPEIGEHLYKAGEIVEIAAIANPGFKFVHWKGDVTDPDSAITTICIDSSKAVMAYFRGVDDVPPQMYNCFPSPNASAVPKNTKIKFRARDKGAGVDLSTLDAWVNSLRIVHRGMDQTGGHVSIKSSAQAYKVTYEPDEPFVEGSRVTVRGTFSDLAIPANSCDSSYSFTVGTSRIDTSSSEVIGQDGGTVSDSTLGVEIHVPVDALEDSIEISISQIEDPPPLPEGVTGIASTLHFGPDGLQFNELVVVEIPYTLEDLYNAGITSPEDLNIFYFHTTTGEWTELNVDSIDVVNMIIYVSVEEFCYFTFGSGEIETDIDEDITNNELQPVMFALSQNYPNPFNPETRIRYQIPEPCHVDLFIYDAMGRRIRVLIQAYIQAGSYEAVWDGKDDYGNQISTGLYLFKLRAGDRILVRKASFVK
jgi:hypothetical protein